MKVIEARCATSQYVRRQQILIDESTGLISATGDLNLPVDTAFGDDCLLFAGMGDVHIHAREDVSGKNNYKEDFTTAQAAMHNGGVTHAGDMPNNPIPPVDDESYAQKLKLAALKTKGEIWTYAGIGPDTRPLTRPVPYKVYMGPSIGELFFKDFETLDQTLSHYQNQWVSFHCEDPEVLEAHKHLTHHHEKRPVLAEAIATRDALALIEKYHLQGKLCHYSSGEGLRLIREARARGAKVQIEVTPQHLYFEMDQILEKDWKSFQMNPPIRYHQDRLELMSALINGEIDFLATDHAPHTHEEKLKGTSGLTGLDTYAGFVTWLLAEGLDPKLMAKVCCENPGTFFNTFLGTWKKIAPEFHRYSRGVGFLEKGYQANFTVLNLHQGFRVTKDFLKTKVQHSPFEGITFPGKLEALYVGGQKV